MPQVWFATGTDRGVTATTRHQGWHDLGIPPAIPWPICASVFSPQQCAFAAVSIAQVCEPPALIAVNVSPPDTSTGIDELI